MMSQINYVDHLVDIFMKQGQTKKKEKDLVTPNHPVANFFFLSNLIVRSYLKFLKQIFKVYLNKGSPFQSIHSSYFLKLSLGDVVQFNYIYKIQFSLNSRYYKKQITLTKGFGSKAWRVEAIRSLAFTHLVAAFPFSPTFLNSFIYISRSLQ